MLIDTRRRPFHGSRAPVEMQSLSRRCSRMRSAGAVFSLTMSVRRAVRWTRHSRCWPTVRRTKRWSLPFQATVRNRPGGDHRLLRPRTWLVKRHPRLLRPHLHEGCEDLSRHLPGIDRQRASIVPIVSIRNIASASYSIWRIKAILVASASFCFGDCKIVRGDRAEKSGYIARKRAVYWAQERGAPALNHCLSAPSNVRRDTVDANAVGG